VGQRRCRDSRSGGGVVSGYRSPGRTRRLVYDEGSNFPGLWVETHGLTFDEWAATNTVDQLVEIFAAKLVSWNWETGDGEPVPPTREGIGRLDASEFRSVASDWLAWCSEVRRRPLALFTPTPPVSTNGSYEQTIPMT
jgi:hypothetical protein